MTRLIAVLLLLSVSVVPALAQADEAQAAKSNGEWRQLFNGKDLEGWEHVGPGRFVIEDGALKSEGGMGLLWYTKEKFGNSVIRVVFKVSDPDSNSGVYVRIADKPKDEWFAVHHGYEVQVHDKFDPYHRTGAIYSLAEAKEASNPIGEWNTMDIALKGNIIEVTLNGKKVTHFDPNGKVPERKQDYEPERGPRPEAGYIGVQNHDDEAAGQQSKKTNVYYKEIAVKPL